MTVEADHRNEPRASTQSSLFLRFVAIAILTGYAIVFIHSFQTTIYQSMDIPVDYPFVKEPSQEFYCPVTFDLMLQPHLTSCCRQHMSQEVVSVLQRERKACPLCRAQCWNTVLDKALQQRVSSLLVFCCHVDRGCRWQGELSAFHHHMESCPMRDNPLISELVELPL